MSVPACTSGTQLPFAPPMHPIIPIELRPGMLPGLAPNLNRIAGRQVDPDVVRSHLPILLGARNVQERLLNALAATGQDLERISLEMTRTQTSSADLKSAESDLARVQAQVAACEREEASSELTLRGANKALDQINQQISALGQAPQEKKKRQQWDKKRHPLIQEKSRLQHAADQATKSKETVMKTKLDLHLTHKKAQLRVSYKTATNQRASLENSLNENRVSMSNEILVFANIVYPGLDFKAFNKLSDYLMDGPFTMLHLPEDQMTVSAELTTGPTIFTRRE